MTENQSELNTTEVAEGHRTYIGYAVELLVAYKWQLTIVIIILGTGFFSGFLDLPTIQVSQETKVALVAMAGGGFFMSPAVVWLVKKVWQPNWEFVAEVDATEKQILDLWMMTPSTVSDIEMVEGNAYSTRTSGGLCHIVRDFNPDELTAIGCWMGEKNDVEIMTAREEMKANRGRLRQWAQIGQNLHSKLPSIAQAVESAYWQAMSSDTLDRTANHPDVVRSEVVADVEKLVESIEIPGENNEGEPDAEEMMEDAVEAEAGKIPEGGDV